MKCPACNNALEHIEGLGSHAGDFNGGNSYSLFYECPNCKGLVNTITEEENGEKMFIRTVYRKDGYKERIKII